jgi:hypothetical protein
MTQQDYFEAALAWEREEEKYRQAGQLENAEKCRVLKEMFFALS